MTVATASTEITPHRSAWRSLFWIVPVTALWTVLIYRQPIIHTSGVATMAIRLMTYAVIVAGLWLGLERTDLKPGQRRTTWLAIVVPFTLWMAVAWSAAINGAFRTDASSLPTLPLAVILPVIIGAPPLLLSRRIGRVLDAMPASWLIALQLYRVYGSAFLVIGLLGVLPGVFAVSAGIGDVLTGLFALPAAAAVATGTAQGRRAAMIWNSFGLADFALALTLGVITSPGPLQLIVPNVPSINDSVFANVLTPAFVVPSSILLHLLSLRQLRRRVRAQKSY